LAFFAEVAFLQKTGLGTKNRGQNRQNPDQKWRFSEIF